MDYGTKNEEIAIATIVCPVGPTIAFYEEGYYVILDKSQKPLILVSPDRPPVLANATDLPKAAMEKWRRWIVCCFVVGLKAVWLFIW